MRKSLAKILALTLLLQTFSLVFTGMAAFTQEPENLALNKTYTTSSEIANYGPALAFDDGEISKYSKSRWASKVAPTPEESVWLAVDLGQSMTLNRVVIYEFQHRMTQYQIEYSDGENDWKVAKAVTGETYDETNPYEITLDFAEVEAQYVRLNILEAKNGEEDLTPSIFEMQIFHIQEEPVPENGNLAYHKTGNTNSSYTSGAYGPELAFDGEKKKIALAVGRRRLPFQKENLFG